MPFASTQFRKFGVLPRFAILLCALLAPLSYAQSDVDLYERALSATAEDDDESASIYLKNALQRNPMHLPSRILLGQLYLKNGRPAAAEKELRRSLELDADPNLVVVPLGYSLLLLESYDEITDYRLPEATDSGVRNEWSMIRGRALLGANKTDDAYALFEGMLRRDPENVGALLGQANARFAQQNYAEAERLVDELLERDSTVPSAWKIKGDIARLEGQTDRAIDLYSKAIESDPGNFAALKDRALLMLERGEQEQALRDIENLREEFPDDPGTVLINSWLLARGKQNAEARSLLDDLAEKLSRVDDSFVARNAQVQLAKGVAFYLQGRVDEALPLLVSFLNRQPNHVGTRMLLARIAQDREQSERVVNLLSPIEGELGDSPELLAPYMRALIKQDKAEKALSLGESLYRAKPNNQDIARLLASTYAYMGESEKAIRVLTQGEESAFTLKSGLMLGYLLLAQNQLPEAAATAQRLQSAYPSNATVANFAGAVFMRAGDLDEAERALAMAMRLDDENLPTRLNSAYLLLKRGDRDGAAMRFRDLVEQFPLETEAAQALSDMESRGGDLNAAIEWTEKLLALEPENYSHLFRLAGLHLRLGNAEQTLEYVARLEREFPLEEPLVELKARAFLAQGKLEQATRWLGFLYGSNSENPARIVEIAKLQMAAKDIEGAGRSVSRLGKLDPEGFATQILSARFELGTGEIDNALQRLRRLEKSSADSTDVQELLADAYWRRRDLPGFRKHYERAQAIEPSVQRLRLAATRFWQAGEPESAEQVLSDWLEEHPGDRATQELYAQALLGLERNRDAYAVYKRLLPGNEPLSYSAYNNIANLAQEFEPELALEFAERAYEMAPENPAVVDTLAWILVRQGNAAKGLPLLREAYSRASQNPSVKYHLAAALAQLDRNAESERILTGLLASDAEFADRDAAEQLLSSLPAVAQES